MTIRCGKCGHEKLRDCVDGIIDPERDPELAYTCINLSETIVEQDKQMPDHNTTADQVQQLRINRQRLREQILTWEGSSAGLAELNRQVQNLTQTILRLNMSDPDATPGDDESI